jgi:DNA-binding transcriptional LysR family regulator
MELRQLQYFVAVARHGQFTRAAEELWITQPALSQQVRRLEAELGVALLRRTSRGVVPTPAGEALLARAETVLAEVAAARADMDRHAGATRGRVRVAATAADAPRLPAALAAFHQAHPGLQVAMRHASAAEVAALARSGAVDVAVAAIDREPPPGVDVTPLPEEPMCAIVAPDDPLSRAGGHATLEDLRGRPFILAEPDTPLRRGVMDACQAVGFSPVPLFEVSDPAAVRYLAHAGLGVSVVPASWLDAPGPAVGALELDAPRHRVALLTPPAGASPAGRLLIAVLREQLGA